jgi:hypothetical protein
MTNCFLSCATEANGAIGLSMKDPNPIVTLDVRFTIFFASVVPNVATLGYKYSTE